MTTKTSAQLDREIAETLSKDPASLAALASTDPGEWTAIFDRLKPGQIIYIAMTSVMGMGRADSGGYFPHKVGRRSKSTKSTSWWSEAVSLDPADGSKAGSFAKYKLWKRKDGKISMSHGDMATMIKGIYAP
jgi:hypothetical protein